MKKYSYILSLFFVFFLPTAYLWSALSIKIPPAQLMAFLGFVTIVGSVYDVWAARHGKSDTHWLWSFNGANTLGFRVLDLPVEEILFYTLSALYIIVTWEAAGIGYATSSYEYLGALVGAALWTVGCITGSFLLVGYDE